jgi:hypothetical protein
MAQTPLSDLSEAERAPVNNTRNNAVKNLFLQAAGGGTQ